jgi:hypothetical protein
VLAEISTHGWADWVAADGGRDWYQAGVEARRRMAAANFDVTQGDSWIVNELSSAVVRGLGHARADIRELVRGLHDGDGGPPVKGGVFTMLMLGQVTSSFPTYKAYLEDWYRDTPFWNDMAAYVSDWSQELFGDIRRYAVEGSSLLERRDALDDYLQHMLRLANAGPDDISAARDFLRSAYSPLANAAWQYDAAFGWTAVPYEQMQDYVSAQTYALRSFSARSGAGFDHFGFAWSPKAPPGMSASQFAMESDALADRLAAALRDSASSAEGACAPSGENLWCSTTVADAAFDPAWKTFASWSPDALALSGPAAATVGEPVTATAELQVDGIAWPEPSPVTASLTSSSERGEFAVAATGPWVHALDLVVPAGSTDVTFYYRDANPGTATLSASAPGRVAATLPLTVTAQSLLAQMISLSTVAAKTFGDPDFGVSATASSGLPVSLAAAGNCSVSGQTVHLTGAGRCTLTATQAGNGSYAPAPSISATFAIAKADQAISFDQPADKRLGDADFALNGSASSGLPVSFTASGNCTVSGAVVHITGVGSCQLTATQPGDSNHNAAPSVARTFAITSPRLKAASKCVVPNVVGKPLRTAKRVIAQRRCRTGRTRYAYSRKTRRGIVIAQSRRPRRLLPANTKIDLVVSRGAKR